MTEAWKPVASAPGYEASDKGRVRTTGHTDRLGRPHKPRVCAQYVNANGYYVIHMRGIRARGGLPVLVSRLVCEAFNGAPLRPGDVARHLDGYLRNNVPANLAWGSQKDNIADKETHGTQTRGEAHGPSKLSDKSVLEIKDMLRRRIPQREIAAQFGVTQPNISCIARGISWSHIT